MRLLDADTDLPLRNVQLYFTTKEARQLCAALEQLLATPDAAEQEHVFAEDMSREISVSLVTPSKLAKLEAYTEAEQNMFREK